MTMCDLKCVSPMRCGYVAHEHRSPILKVDYCIDISESLQWQFLSHQWDKQEETTTDTEGEVGNKMYTDP